MRRSEPAASAPAVRRARTFLSRTGPTVSRKSYLGERSGSTAATVTRMAKLLDEREMHAALAELAHWEARDNALFRAVQAPAFRDGIRLVDEVAAVADQLDHHPDIDIRWTTVSFSLSTHSAGGITAKDIDLAARIDGIVDRLVPPA